MKIGKVPESVLKRSVFKQIKTKRPEVLVGAGVGEDCAVMQLEPDEVFVLSTDPITGTVQDVGRLCVHVTANDLASAGAAPVGILLTALLPEDMEEETLRGIMAQVEEVCEELHIQVMGGHTEVTRAVQQPLITVTGVGKVKKDRLVTTGGAKPGDDVVVTKWIGIEGTAIIAKEKEAQLLARYPEQMIRTAREFDQYISVVRDAAAALKSGVSAMHDVTEGGIYGALWELAEASGVGLDIDLMEIPVRQETIEICEYFDLNPYYLISSGCMLMTDPDGYGLVRALKQEGIPAAVIGKVTEGKARIVRNQGEITYLERPKTDELYRIYEV